MGEMPLEASHSMVYGSGLLMPGEKGQR